MTLPSFIDFGDTVPIEIDQTCDITSLIQNNGTINNNGIINIFSILPDQVGILLNNGTINNDGTITNGVTINGIIINVDTINNGNVITNTVDGLITNLGTINNDNFIANEGEISNNGTIINNNNSLINNFGTINNNGDGQIINDQTSIIDNANVLDNDGIISNINSSLIGNRTTGIINNKGDIFNSNQSSISNGGTINNEGNIFNEAGITQVGIINNDGHIFNSDLIINVDTINNNADGQIINNEFFQNNSTINNNGTIYNNEVFLNIPFLTNGTTAIINNNFTIENDGNIVNDNTINNDNLITNRAEISNNGTINNNGTLKNDDLITNTMDGLINNNNGTINNNNLIANEGEISNGGTINNQGEINNAGTFDNQDDGILKGSGIFTVNELIIDEGIFQPEGFTVETDFTFTDTGTLNLFDPNSDNPLLTITGNANLSDGTIAFDDLSSLDFGIFTLIDGSDLTINESLLTEAQATVDEFDTEGKDFELIQQDNDLILEVEEEVVVFSGIGDITEIVETFRVAVGEGSENNGNEIGSQEDGFREINWDGGAVPFNMPGNFFNNQNPPVNGLPRGVEFSTASDVSLFGVSNPVFSADPFFGDDEFDTINPTYPEEFTTFSEPRLFSPLDFNIMDVDFFEPGVFDESGDPVPALVTGFGAIFTDVDLPESTKLEFFDNDGDLLFSQFVEPDPEGLSFLGVEFNEAIVSKVRITSGNVPLGQGLDDDPFGTGVDVVAMDNFIYGEPIVA